MLWHDTLIAAKSRASATDTIDHTTHANWFANYSKQPDRCVLSILCLYFCTFWIIPSITVCSSATIRSAFVLSPHKFAPSNDVVRWASVSQTEMVHESWAWHISDCKRKSNESVASLSAFPATRAAPSTACSRLRHIHLIESDGLRTGMHTLARIDEMP